MCGLNAYNKKYDKSTDATNFGGGRPVPEDSTINPLVSMFVIISFIYLVQCLGEKLCGFLCISWEYEREL